MAKREEMTGQKPDYFGRFPALSPFTKEDRMRSKIEELEE